MQPRACCLVQAASCAELLAGDLMLGSSSGVHRRPSATDGARAPRVGSMLRIEIGQGLRFRAVEMAHTRRVVTAVVQVGAPLVECRGAAERGVVVDHGRAELALYEASDARPRGEELPVVGDIVRVRVKGPARSGEWLYFLWLYLLWLYLPVVGAARDVR